MISTISGLVVGVAMIPYVAIYIAAESAGYRDGFLRPVPKEKREFHDRFLRCQIKFVRKWTRRNGTIKNGTKNVVILVHHLKPLKLPMMAGRVGEYRRSCHQR